MALNQSFAPVTKVNDKQGDVTITATDVGLGAYAGTTPSTLPVSASTQTALERRTYQAYTLTELRNYDIQGSRMVYLTLRGSEGFYYYDAADTTSVDNGDTVIVAFNNKRYKKYTTVTAPTFSNQGFAI